jgi:DNA-binding transcriptional MerR regulator
MPEESLTPSPTVIPDKLFFRIGEVSRLAGVEAYVLRYWETEFPLLRPKKSGKGQRLYRRKDVETILEIKCLLYEKRYTIEGARNLFASRPKQPAPPPPPKHRQGDLFAAPSQQWREVRDQLREILNLLK